MFRANRFLLILILLTVVIILFMFKKVYQNVYEIRINGESTPYLFKSVKIEDGEIYFATTYLEEYCNMRAEMIDSGKGIALYKGETSITFTLGKGKGKVFEKSNKYFVPLKSLIEGLGGKYVWDKDNKIIVINFY